MPFTLTAVTDILTHRTDCVVLPVAPGRLKGWARDIDRTQGGLIKRAMNNGDFTGEAGETLTLHLSGQSTPRRALLVGTGRTEQGRLTPAQWRTWVQKAAHTALKMPIKTATVDLSNVRVRRWNDTDVLRQFSSRWTKAAYRYRRTLSKPDQPPSLKRIRVHAGATRRVLKTALQQGEAIGDGVNLARELGNLPGNLCTPGYLASEARKLGRRFPELTTQVLNETKMRELGMGALLSVTEGSTEPAKLIVMKYQGGAKSDKPVVLVGKGITFDSGGISIKPGARMDEMKFDMCGAASVFGAVQAAAQMALPVNLIGVVAAAENLPSGTATKPGDVITSLSGKTIEVLNTDAEGRLVLCDALTYARRFKPEAIIDIATLTGACVVALGKHASAVYSHNDQLAEDLLAAGRHSGDRAWRMPLWKDYTKQLKSRFADLANVGGPEAGSITAACFLGEFTDGLNWAHMDIAGTAWNSGASKGATGRPVSLLVRYLMQRSGAA